MRSWAAPATSPEAAPKKNTHESSTTKALTVDEQTKVDFMKDVKSFNNKVVNDMKVFSQLHFKGKTMLGDKTSDVTNKLLHALAQANHELKKWEQVVMELF